MEITVQPGQTLTSIARDNNSTPQAIAEANGIVDVNKISEGQKLSIPDAPIVEEPGVVPANNNISDDDLLLEQLGTFKTNEEDLSQQGYGSGKGKFTGAGIDVSLEGEGDLDTAERDFTQGMVTETKPGSGTYNLDITKGITDTPISEASQFAEGGVTEGGVALEPTQKEVEVTPVITGDELAAIPEGSAATTVSATNLDKVELPGGDIPPTESELTTLINSLKPLSTGGKKVYEGVETALKGIEFDNTEDAKVLYEQLSEDAERETKKIDDSIAEIAEEKIKPTFTGFNKFMAVLGAAMGAYGSSMTGTPNFALQIMNRAIDADQEQFLASQEIRTKSLLEQRQAVLQRRSDLLQLGLNEADKMLKVAQLQQDNELKIANVQGVIDGINNAAIENKNEQTLLLIQILSKKAAATKLAEKTESKEKRLLGVPGIDLTDGEGNTGFYPGYFAATEDEAKKLRKNHTEAMQIEGILNKLDEVSKDKFSTLSPAALSDTSTQIEDLTAQLIVKLKEVYGMGANFSEYEQSLIIKQVPDDSWGAKFTGMWATKSANLRDQIIRIRKSQAASQGAKFATTPNAADAKKRDFIKAGVAP